MPVERLLREALVIAVAVVVSGCTTTTLVARVGPLAGGHTLLTLLVTDNLDVVKQECAGVSAHGRVLGCQRSSPVKEAGWPPVRSTTIVRYAETVPTPVTFEIEAHELCHALAAVQWLPDPCHVGNGGELRAMESPPISLK